MSNKIIRIGTINSSQDCVVVSPYDIAIALTAGYYNCPKIIIDDTQGFDGVRIYKDYAPSLRANRSGLKTMSNLRIRKLTPKECWRLMGFDDEDHDRAAAVVSNSQLYKQAGNSIVVDVLEHLLGNIKELTYEEVQNQKI